MTTERRRPTLPRVPIGLDGTPRTIDDEMKLNAACWHAFRGADGEAVLDWLRSLTRDVVLDPSRSDAELRHLEGMRHLLKLIETRILIAERTPR